MLEKKLCLLSLQAAFVSARFSVRTNNRLPFYLLCGFGSLREELALWGNGGLALTGQRPARQLEDFAEEGGGVAGFGLGDFFGGSGGDDFAALGASFGADVEDVVGFGDDIEVVFDHDDGAAFID
jgi:hypothetical protein